MCFGPKVTDKQDQCQVADLEAAGDHPHVSALQVEPPLQGGQHAHLKTTTEHHIKPQPWAWTCMKQKKEQQKKGEGISCHS